MKPTYCILYMMVLAIAVSCAPQKNDKAADDALHTLLEQKDYFSLKEKLKENKDKLSEDRLLFYRVFVNKAFGEREKSNEDINTLFSRHRNTLNDTLIVKLLDAQAANYLYLYEYRKAATIYKDILTHYRNVLDSSDVADYSTAEALFGTFGNTPPQKMQKQKDVLLKSYRNKFNHLMTPVRVAATNEDFIFDTGANLSTISESQARKMKLKIFEQRVDIGSATSKEVASRLAVADSLYLGDILFENVVFIVMPDNQLTFPEINYTIKGIIGFPVIHQLGEVHLQKNGTIWVPKTTTKKADPNMFFEGLNPVVKVISGSETLLFTFDTGASRSELSFKYFNDHKSAVEEKGKKQTNQRGGVGGKVAVNEFMLTDFPLEIGKRKTRLDTIPVTLEEYDFNKYFDGNLGQDVFMKFNSLVINFDGMYIDLK